MTGNRQLLRLAFVVPLLTATSAPALVDGEVIESFGGGDGIATWPTNADSFRLAAVASSDGLLVGVGDYEAGDAPPAHVAWQAVDRDGVLLSDHRCAAPTGDWLPFGVSSAGLAALVDSSGNLVIGGYATFTGSTSQRRPLVARYRLDIAGCVLDPTFSGSGWEIFDDVAWCDGESCSVIGLAEIRPSTGAVVAPRLVALVRSSAGLVAARHFLLGLTANGTIDGGFGESGWTEILRVENATLGPYAVMATGPAGRIHLLVSYFDPTQPLDLDIASFRFDPDGARATQGPTELDDDFDDVPYDLAIANDGALFGTQPAAQEIMVRWTQDLGGSGYHEAIWGARIGRGALTLQGNGRVLDASIDAKNPDRILVARGYTAAGGATAFEADPAFGVSAVGVQNLFADDLGLAGWSLSTLSTWHGRPIVAGTGEVGAREVGFLLPLANAFVFADGFEGGSLAFWSASAP